MNPLCDASADDHNAPVAEALMPIRKVAQLTGVNPVTLRAWERRYGLIKPQRTPKGHRLYSDTQVAQIRAVIQWLERGVAVSQVKPLLEQNVPAPALDDSNWQVQLSQARDAVERLAERSLDEGINRALALYPTATACQHLLWPLLESLELRWAQRPDLQLERSFFFTWLRSKLGARLYHNNRLGGGAPLLLFNISARPMEPGLWLCAWLASDAGCPVQVFDGPAPLQQLGLAAHRLGSRALLLYGNQRLNAETLAQLPNNLSCPFLLCGAAGRFHRHDPQGRGDLHAAGDPLDALHCLRRLGLLDAHRSPATDPGHV